MEFNNYSINADDDPMSLTSLLHGAPLVGWCNLPASRTCAEVRWPLHAAEPCTVFCQMVLSHISVRIIIDKSVSL